MRIILLVISFFPAIIFAQDIHKCLSREAVDYHESLAPGYKAHIDEQFELAKQWSANHEPKRNVYTIPVVFHVVYKNQGQNIHDSVLLNQIAVLNADYARLNADTVNMRNAFGPVAGATQINFVLASADPLGNPTSGITRTATTTEFGSFNIFFGDFTDVEKVKSTADGGHDAWDQDRYLNIWVCDMSVSGSTFLLGYATPPDDLPNWPAGSTDGMADGVVLQYSVIGSNNPVGLNGYVIKGRTASHEVGHYLGLRHIWGDGDDCSAEDGIDDTPHATDASQQDCDDTKNTCTDAIAGLGDLPDMIENFMDYSAEDCQNSFTHGQALLMHGVLENQRYDLVHNNAALSITEEVITFSCYPNPASTEVHISSAKEMQEIVLSDMNGKLISKQHAGGKTARIDTQALAPGIYTVRIVCGNGATGQQRITVAQ